MRTVINFEFHKMRGFLIELLLESQGKLRQTESIILTLSSHHVMLEVILCFGIQVFKNIHMKFSHL